MGKLEFELEVKCPADKFWGGMKDTTVLFPKIFPQRFKSIEVVEGDGVNAGTVRLVRYAEDTPVITFAKEKVELLDDVNKVLVYSVIDGELMTHYKSLKGKVEVVPIPKGEGEGSLVKWSLEFEKASDEVPDPILMQDYATNAFIGLNAYLLKEE
ncbi:Mlp-like protein [Thalictrum thalictroides]|uniref:Mlp-like protein n=1 Tax=Thalictrum thalictroides TaxID=46969 RepID=A0A7J6VAN9_THATH|nr:Mlp-like protein [Thalictrum thalictroides]